MQMSVRQEINKIRWEKWRAKQNNEREKTYFHCWSDCNVVSGPYIDFCINYKRSGQSNCQGGTGSWIDISAGPCLYNTVMRFARAGESSGFYAQLSQCYWREKSGCPEHCYMEAYGWNKPIRSAFVGNNSIPFGHFICAEHLGGDVTNFNNWKFFQYSNLNIQPGDPNQMPRGTATENTAVRIREITSIGSCGGSVLGDYVACFEIDKDCYVSNVSCPP
ncbi:hypothetical protein C5S36_09865 [Candidatus Methanophagaceae archaeon]|nr:hypothetical protein C5S36_09865 [Methanophagales archaeon]